MTTVRTENDSIPQPQSPWPGVLVTFHPIDETDDVRAFLTVTEQSRAAKFLNEKTRSQFIAGRSCLRKRLAEVLKCLPVDVPIAIREDGKPIVPGDPIHFNIAHSGDWLMIATADRPVGVDLERIREMPNAKDLLERFFTKPECDQYLTMPEEVKVKSFFRGWTCKEAVLKADGRGMRIVDRCTVCFDPRLPARVIDFDAGQDCWDVECFAPMPDYIAAVAVKSN